MSNRHLPFWPRTVPRHLTIPETDLFFNAEVSARRYPDKAFLVFYDTVLTFSRFRDEAQSLAGYLQTDCGIRRGDRVLLYLQNSPQFVIGYYAILRAGGMVVPVNPMNLTQELRHQLVDSGARVIIGAQDLVMRIEPLLAEAGEPVLDHVIVATYSDYIGAATDLTVPDFIAAARQPLSAVLANRGVAWTAALAAGRVPRPNEVGPDDLCVMPYTSGTTGQPKGCVHTHRSVMYQARATLEWVEGKADHVQLAVLPFFHVTGMMSSMNCPVYGGSTVVLLPRWDRDAAARCIARYRITSWTAIPTMLIDFLANPNLAEHDLSSLTRLSGGGAAMPAAVAQKLMDMGLTYNEGYGLSETIAASHINPPLRPKNQCLGIPIIDVDSRVVDPVTLAPVPQGDVGEIVTHGPQVFQGYWQKPEATRDCFVEIDGKRFFRTGDLARIDEDGYFFMVDRLKRMINASGYKVWPAEVEAMMYQHPAIQEACVIATRDPHRGETVKAVVVLKTAQRGQVSEQAILDWCRETMAAYKAPRIVQFVESLPRSGTGKVMWRALQDNEP